MKAKQIGINVEIPKQDCKDINCPFHGNLRVRGRMFLADVSKVYAGKSSTVEFVYYYYLPKYERYEKRRTRLKVHNPGCINAKLHDKVRVIESRPISKTKSFVIIEVIKK